MKTGVMTSWKHNYFNSATYDREKLRVFFAQVNLRSKTHRQASDRAYTCHAIAICEEGVLLHASASMSMYVHVQGIHTSLKFTHVSLWLVVCMTVSISCTYTCMQIKQDLFWMLSFALLNHGKGCFVASEPWFILHLSQVHLHPQLFTMLPDPSTSTTECGRKWDETGTAHLFLRSLVTPTGYHIKLLQTFVNDLLFSSWLRKQYNFLESKIFRWMM